MIRGLPGFFARLVRALRHGGARAPFRPAPSGRRGAVTVEYALAILIAAAILMGVEKEIFRPMAKDILKDFMEFIVKPDP